jgi:transcriptional regulator with XRE-family HTH domain
MCKKRINRVKKIREEQKLTVRELADLTEMSFSALSDIENWKSIPSQESILRICYALKRKTHEVFMLNADKTYEYFVRNSKQKP